MEVSSLWQTQRDAGERTSQSGRDQREDLEEVIQRDLVH